jgi:hypothetical protein
MPQVIPFTEAWETAKTVVGDRRVDATTEKLYRRLCNLIYTKAIPQVLEWEILKKEGTPIAVNGDYRTGTLTMTSGSATVTLAGGTFPSAVVNGWKLKITSGADQDDVYEVLTRNSDTSLTLKRTFLGTTASLLTYTLYQDFLELPSDFDKFTTNPRLWYRSGGTVQYLTYKEDELFLGFQDASVGIPEYFRLHPNLTSNDLPQIQFNTGWDEDTLIYLEYIELLSELTEYTTDTVDVTNNSTTVSASPNTSTLWSTNVAANDYFRVDDQGDWFKVSSVTNNSTIVLASVYTGPTKTAKRYTISKNLTVIPEIWQNAVIYGTAALAAAHQDDEAGFARWQGMSGIPVGVLTSLARQENRVNYGNQRMRTVYQTTRGVRR